MQNIEVELNNQKSHNSIKKSGKPFGPCFPTGV